MKCLFACLALAAAAPASAQSPDQFAYAVPIEATAGEAFYRLAIPQSAYEGTAFDDLRDLRVFNAKGEAVPHAFRSAGQQARKFDPVPLAIFPLMGPRGARAEDLDLSIGRAGDRVNVRLRGGNGNGAKGNALLGYLIDASAIKTTISGVTMTWAADATRQLTVVKLESSPDLKRWTELVPDAPLGAIAHAGQRLERSAIEFRGEQGKYIRLTWLDPDKAFALESVRWLVPEQSGQPERSWIEVLAQPDAASPGEYAFELKGRLPVDRLAFGLPQENTVAPLEVLARNDEKAKWQPVASTVAYRLRQEGRELVSADVAVYAGSKRFWLVRVNAKGGGLGAGPLKVRAGWTPRELVFVARGDAPFRLAYGNARAEQAAMPVDTLVPGLQSEHPPKLAAATTGAQQQLAGAAALDAPADRKKYVLWAALVAAVAVLGWMAWMLSRQMQKPEA